MVRLSVSVDPELLEEAVRVSGAGSKREAIEIALRELVRRRRLARLAERAGTVDLAITRDDLLKGRAEE